LIAIAALTIWVAESQVAAPSTGALSEAAREMLGADVRVRTETFPDEHPEAATAPAAGEESAVVSWDSPRHEHARLRICRAANDCLERWVTFEASDPELERGRTLGFLVASVVLNQDATATETSPAPPAAATAPPLAPLSVQPSASRAAPRFESARVTQPPRRFPRGELTAAAVVSGPGDTTTLGASLGADYAQSPRLRLGLSAELRFGELTAAQASSEVASLLARASYVLVRPAASVWLGVSGGVGAYYLAASHFSSDDRVPDRQGRFLVGGTFGGTGGLDFNGTSTLYCELGAELLAGKTTIFVHDQPRATWPLAAPFARVGLRAAF
jgi:hypothetical protein